MMGCNLIAPQVFWTKWARSTPWFIFIMSIIVNIGMWFERFVIIVPTLCRTFVPGTWNMYHPSFVDIGIFVGTIGMFFTFFLLYARTFPVIAQAELKTILKSSGEAHKKLAANHSHDSHSH
jgi:molybdopterin-containing oxidoreductase family membrane subunit